jgi:outer membrane protein with beta-barrel domain
MARLWRLLAIAAAMHMTAGAAIAAAQTVLVRNAPPGLDVEAVLNDTVTAKGTTSPAGEVSLDLKLPVPELDANIFVDVCDKLRRVLVVDHNKRASAPPAGCDRREISGVFWVRPINTLVVDLGGAQPAMLLIRGSYTPPKPAPAEGEEGAHPLFPTPKGLTLFGSGGLGQFRDAILVACGNVACDGHDGGLAYAFGGGFWFTRWVGVQGGYLKPRQVAAKGGDGFTFDSKFDVDVFTVTGMLGVPMGRVRAYGIGGADFHQSTSSLTETIDAATQLFSQRTHGWALVYGAGAEVWATKKVALFTELSVSRIKGNAEDKGEAQVSDHLRYFGIGVKIRLSR